jgi:hypothetical protein
VTRIFCWENSKHVLPLLGYTGNPKLSSATVRQEIGMTTGGIYKWERKMGEITERVDGMKWIKVQKN